MWYFIALYSLIFFILYISKKRPNLENICYTIIILVLSIFSGLRVGVGRDYMMYQECFYNPLNHSNYYFEKSWIIINYVFRLLHLSFHDWLFIISLTTTSLMYYGAKKLKIDLFWFTLLYIFVVFGYVPSMNITRQFLAISIVFANIHNIFGGHKVRFLLSIIVASVFHSSAIFFLILFPIMWQKWTPLLLTISILISFIIGGFLFKPFLLFISDFIPARYALYFETDKFGAVVSTGLYRYFLNTFAIILLYTWKKDGAEKDSLRSISTNIVVLSICIYNIMYNFNDGIRIIYYGTTFIFIIIPYYLTKEYSTTTKTIYLLILIGFIFFGVKAIFDPVEPYFQYRTVFENYNYNNRWI